MIAQKESNKTPMTTLRNTDIWSIWKEFRIILLKQLSKLQGNTDRQLNEIRKTMHEQKNQDIKKQTNRNLKELKKTMTKMKNLIESFKRRLDQATELVN